MSSPETIGDNLETLGDMERIERRLDHIDDQLHEIRRFIEDNRIHLERFTKNPVLNYLKAGKRG